MADIAQFLSRKSVALAQRRADYQADPTSAVITVSARSVLSHETFARPTTMGDTTLISDSKPALGGAGLGPSAPEMLLGALASCLLHTYLLQAVLLNIPLTDASVEVHGELDMSGVVGLPYDQPPQMNNIRYSARVASPAGTEAIARLHAAVEETCPVLNTLTRPTTVRRITD